MIVICQFWYYFGTKYMLFCLHIHPADFILVSVFVHFLLRFGLIQPISTGYFSNFHHWCGSEQDVIPKYFRSIGLSCQIFLLFKHLGNFQNFEYFEFCWFLGTYIIQGGCCDMCLSFYFPNPHHHKFLKQ